jgi:hypothetical protein
VLVSSGISTEEIRKNTSAATKVFVISAQNLQAHFYFRDEVDLDVGETTVETHPFPNGIPSDVAHNLAVKTTPIFIVTTSTTTSAPSPVAVPSKPSPSITSGGKRVNYNYHPIIDYFRTQQSKSLDHGNTQEWTPIVGNSERLTKETSS